MDLSFGEDNFDNMTNINKKLREKLKAVAEIKAPEVAVEQRSAMVRLNGRCR